MNITVISNAFEHGGKIPEKYTCDGSNISPPLEWSISSNSIKSYALIADDPDAPMGTWVHWVLFNIPADKHKLPEAIPTEKVLEDGSKQGVNSSNKIGYSGPCPPSGTHRYYFKIYALDKMLNLEPGITKAQLLNAMGGHIIGEGNIMGRYSRR